MAEETPAILDMTVIWRPLDEAEYRIDWVVAEAGCPRAAIFAAADAYIREITFAEGEEPLTPESIIEGDNGGYDLIAIFEGHLSPAFMG